MLDKFLYRNIDSIIKVLTRLEKRLQAHIDKQERKAEAFRTQQFALKAAEANATAEAERAARIKDRIGAITA